MARRYSGPALVAVCCLGISQFAVAQERVLGVVPQGAAHALAQQWQPLLNQLQKSVGQEIHFVTAPTITQFEQRVLKGEFDYAYVNPLLFVRARKQVGYRALVRRSDPLRGIVVTGKDAPAGISSLKDAIIAFPSPTALGATILTRAELDRRKIHYSVSYVGTHESGYQGVAIGRYRAAGGVRRTFELLPEETRKKLKIILETRPLPGHVIAVHPRISDSEANKVRAALLALDRDHQPLLKALNVDHFVTSKPSDFRALNNLKLPPVRSVSRIAFHVIPRLGQQDTVRQMMPLISYIRQNLELELELKTYNTMTAFDKAIDKATGPALINANPLQAIRLAKKGYQIIAQQTPVSSPHGMRSVILVNKGSGIHKISDLKNKRVAFGGNRNAFFASVVPRVLLARNGLHGKYIDASKPGTVADVVRRLQDGEIDAAGTGAMAINSELLKAKYHIDEMPVLLSSEPMPGLAWLVSKNLPADVREELSSVLLHFGPSSPGHEAMTTAGIAGLKPATVRTYASVKKYIDEERRLR